MASLNKALIIGHLGRDPETRYMPDGGAVTNISIATTETWKDKSSGEKKEATTWHNVVFFGKLAEIAGEYLKKGALVYVEGRLQTDEWEKDGVKRYTTKIIAASMQMLGSRGGGSAQQAGASAEKPAPSKPKDKFDDFEDDIPF